MEGIDNIALDITSEDCTQESDAAKRKQQETEHCDDTAECKSKHTTETTDSYNYSISKVEEAGQKTKVNQKFKDLDVACNRALTKKHNRLPPNPTVAQKVKYSLLCPPKGDFSVYISLVFILLFLWGVGAAVSHDFYPGQHLFALLVLVVAGYIGGVMVEAIRLPALLGMLLVGILLRNIPVPYINVGNQLNPDWSSKLRNIALVVILSRAGLGLDPIVLKRLSFVVLRLAFSPCLIEAISVAVASHFLIGLPWIWAFMMGFIQAAVSPAVVVPCLLNMHERGYGVKKGIPTLVIAAASLDDVLAISAFGITLGLTFSEGDLGEQAAHGPLEVIMGLGFGIVMGVIAWYLPNRKYGQVTLLRVLFLLLGGLLAVLGSGEVGYAGAGALGCLVFAFVAAHGWRRQGMLGEGNMISQSFATMWKVLQPVLFGLIGTEIIVSVLDPSTVAYGLLTLLVGLVLRLITSFIVVSGGGLNVKEKLFVAIAWLPKATVQAAIGPVALDHARQRGDAEAEHYAIQVLTIAVLVILVTAPIGAAAIMLSGPKLLERQIKENEKNDKV